MQTQKQSPYVECSGIKMFHFCFPSFFLLFMFHFLSLPGTMLTVFILIYAFLQSAKIVLFSESRASIWLIKATAKEVSGLVLIIECFVQAFPGSKFYCLLFSLFFFSIFLLFCVLISFHTSEQLLSQPTVPASIYQAGQPMVVIQEQNPLVSILL